MNAGSNRIMAGNVCIVGGKRGFARAAKHWALALACVATALAFPGTASAAEPAGRDAPPSAESVRDLLAATNARQVVDQMMSQVKGMLDNAMQNALQGQTLPPEKMKILDEMQLKSIEILRETLAWEKMEPLYVDIYRKSLTQSEVDGIVAFYRSPAGRAYTAKMPVIVQNTMQSMQTMMAELQPKLAKLQQETMQKLQASGE